MIRPSKYFLYFVAITLQKTNYIAYYATYQ